MRRRFAQKNNSLMKMFKIKDKFSALFSFIFMLMFVLGLFNHAYAMIPPPASHVWLFYQNYAVLSFKGNIHAQALTIVTSPLKIVQGGDIISWNNIGTGAKTPIYGRWKIGGYAQAEGWDQIKSNVEDAVSRLKKYAIDLSPSCNLPTVLSDNNNPPEGKIYYCKNPQGGAVSISRTFSGKGTLIIENGDLNITGNVDYSSASSPPASLGVIVINGNININNNVQTLRGAYFAEKDITFNQGVFESIDFKGLVAGSTIKLPSRGSFSYDANIATNPPPGFREIFKALYQEVSP